MVLVFWIPSSAERELIGAPNLQLVGFRRVQVGKENTEQVKVLVVDCNSLSSADIEGKRRLMIGQHTLAIGSASEGQVMHHLNIEVASNGSDSSSNIVY